MSDAPKIPAPSNWSCPAPAMPVETVQVAHGGGGRMSRNLVGSPADLPRAV